MLELVVGVFAWIARVIAWVFIEILFETLFMGISRLFGWVGIRVLRIFRGKLSTPIEEFKREYQDSIIPPLVGGPIVLFGAFRVMALFFG